MAGGQIAGAWYGHRRPVGLAHAALYWQSPTQALSNPAIPRGVMLYHYKYRNLMVDHTLKLTIGEVF